MAKKGKRWGPKVTYLRDWAEINEGLVQRGVYYLDFSWVQNWDKELEEMNKEKVGKPYEYPESLIKVQGLWTQHVGVRQAEGITRKVADAGLIPKPNDYSTISRRVNNLDLSIQLPEFKELSAALDGSGMKINMAGEYFEDKYGDGKKKYIKPFFDTFGGCKERALEAGFLRDRLTFNVCNLS
jgi:hypothetical protein